MDRYTAISLLRDDPNGITKEFETHSGTWNKDGTWNPYMFSARLLFIEKEKQFCLLFNKEGSSKFHVAKKITYQQVLRFLKANFEK